MGCEGIGQNSECSVGSANEGSDGNLGNLAVDNGSETVIVISSDVEEIGDLNLKKDMLGSSKSALVDDIEGKLKGSENKQLSCVIDIKCGSEEQFEHDLEGERVCRICHLSSDRSSSSEAATTTTTTSSSATVDLIHLGCGCKGELGTAHIHCAEAWFKLRGNRQCEICGETVQHIKGVGDSRFMEEWNDRATTSTGLDAGARDVGGGGGGCWRGQPFCNFLMACLVIAFVLPWFFRVNMF